MTSTDRLVRRVHLLKVGGVGMPWGSNRAACRWRLHVDGGAVEAPVEVEFERDPSSRAS
jgi:hypothetical protein